MNILSKLKQLRKSYFWNEIEKKLFTVFSENLNKQNVQKKEVILIQCVEDYYYYSLFGLIIQDLRKLKNIQVEQYVLRNFSVGSYNNIRRFVKNKIFVNRWTDRKWTSLYGSYCNRIAYSNEQYIGLLLDIELFLKAKKITQKLQSKEELVALKQDGLLIGDLVYDTYLRFKPAPTVDLRSFYLVIVIWKALRNIQISENYFSIKKPRVLLQSYSTYIQHGITARVALKYDVDVYTFGSYQSMVKKLSIKDHSHVAFTARYKSEFDTLSDKDNKYLKAKEGLESRLVGRIDLATSYMRESAYKILDCKIPDVKGAVVVFLHDFFDSPHIYNSMVFPDFLEWIEFTINELETNSVLYYLKPHPNQLPESSLVVQKLCKKYPCVKLLSPKITNKQLVESGMKLGVTVYGTVAHELVYMGVPVITCGDNPHSSYNFCHEANNKEQYAEYLKETNTFLSKGEKVKKEVMSFYYMHSLNRAKEELVLSKMAALRKLCESFDKNLWNAEYKNILFSIKNNSEYTKFIQKL